VTLLHRKTGAPGNTKHAYPQDHHRLLDQFPPERCEGQVLFGKRVMTNWTQKGPWENKTNLPTWTQMDAGRGSHRRSCRSGRLRQTNPICRRWAGKTIAKAGGLDDATRQGQVRQTNPICPASTAMGTGGQGRKCCRRRGQARQTKPIAPERGEEQVPCGKRVMTHLTRKGPGQNKANCRGPSDTMDLESATVCRHTSSGPPRGKLLRSEG
jgi:hypothetical protein